MYAAIFGKNIVSVIDGSTDAVVKNIPVGNSPRAIAVFASGSHRRVYVANRYSNNVSIIDGNTDSVVATVPTGASPKVIAVDPNRGFAYVTSTASDTVTVIDDSDQVVATIPVGDNPIGVAVDPAGRRVFVANYASNSVSVIDADTLSVVATVATGVQPMAIAVDRSSRKVVRQLLREQFGHHDRQLAGCDIHRHRLSPVRAGHRRGPRLASGLQRELGREQRDRHRPAGRRRRSGQRDDRPDVGRHDELDVPGVLGNRRKLPGAATVQHRRGVLSDRTPIRPGAVRRSSTAQARRR